VPLPVTSEIPERRAMAAATHPAAPTSGRACLALASPPCRRWSGSRYKLQFDAILAQHFRPAMHMMSSGGVEPWSTSMATQIVMDQTGDTRHYFNADDTEALSKAEERFELLISVGFTAAIRDAAGKATVTRSFDPTAEETLFFPRLVGG
jgi:hypothetical protein